VAALQRFRARSFQAGLVLSGLLCLAACSDYDRARNAYEGGDYTLAISRFEALAVKGDTKAQYDLAQIYFQGIGTAKDSQKGWYWLLSAAGMGNVAAMVQLGALFESGVGAERDYATAAQWYLRAARKGDAVGRFNLALMYYKGIGVPKDEVAALAWFRLSFKAGSAAARDRADEVERELTKAEVQRAEELIERLAQAAE
jgi:TPR repeat protein